MKSGPIESYTQIVDYVNSLPKDTTNTCKSYFLIFRKHNWSKYKRYDKILNSDIESSMTSYQKRKFRYCTVCKKIQDLNNDFNWY